MSLPKFETGDQFCPVYPYVRLKYDKWEDGEVTEIDTWNPGVNFESLPPYGEDTRAVAHGEGGVYYKVVDVFKPDGYPEHVFYVRQWVDPDGKYFGKKNLRIATTQKFRRLISGYRFEYDIEEIDDAA